MFHGSRHLIAIFNQCFPSKRRTFFSENRKNFTEKLEKKKGENVENKVEKVYEFTKYLKDREANWKESKGKFMP